MCSFWSSVDITELSWASGPVKSVIASHLTVCLMGLPDILKHLQVSCDPGFDMPKQHTRCVKWAPQHSNLVAPLFFPVLSIAVGVELAQKQEKGKNECGDDDV